MPRIDRRILAALAVVVAGLSALAVWAASSRSGPPPRDGRPTLGDVEYAIRSGDAAAVVLYEGDQVVEVQTASGDLISAAYPSGYAVELVKLAAGTGVPVVVEPASGGWTAPAAWALLTAAAVLIAASARHKTGGLQTGLEVRESGRTSDRQGQARPEVRFSDVAGIDEVVDELSEVVGFLKDPERYRKVGTRLPKGYLLVGPPGVGKTLVAKAVAGEATVRFSTCPERTSSRSTWEPGRRA